MDINSLKIKIHEKVEKFANFASAPVTYLGLKVEKMVTDPSKLKLPSASTLAKTAASIATLIPSIIFGIPSKVMEKIIEPSISNIIASVSPIKENFTTEKTIQEQRIAHVRAQIFLLKYLPKVGASSVDFIKPPQKVIPKLSTVEIKKELNPKVFQFQYTKDVTNDIIEDGKKESKEVIVYGVASQFNGCEAMTRMTHKPGEAVKEYVRDPTQGPRAQLAFPDEQVELINCAGNLGFNGLCNVLDEYTKHTLVHGYFTPLKTGSDGFHKIEEKIIQQLTDNGHEIEYLCVSNIPKGGKKEIYQILTAAPALSETLILEIGRNKVARNVFKEAQFLCALHAYRAQFQQCLHLAEKSGESVTFKPVAVGIGAFGNDPEIVAKAFYQAAIEYQADLDKKNVSVLFQIYNGKGLPDPNSEKMAKSLGLKELEA